MRAMILFFGLMAASTGFGSEPNQMTVPESEPLSEISPKQRVQTLMGQLDCFSRPGRRYCRDLRRFDNLMIDCNGDACYDLWDAQLAKIDDIIDWFDDNVGRRATFTREIGEDTEDVARLLCGTRVTGDASYITRLVVAYNDVLDVFEEIQERAGDDTPYTCTFRIE